MIEVVDARERHPARAPMESAFLAVICAVGTEKRYLMPLTRPGVEVLAAGIGPVAARRRGEQVLARGATAIVSAGFCGALSPKLHVGDLVAADLVVDAATKRAFAADPDLLSRAPGQRGTLVSAPRLVRTPADRRLLTGLACDMESAALAQVAAHAGVPFLALRAVTDEAHHTLPDFDRLTDRAGQLTPGLGLVHFLLRPADLPRLVRLWPASRRAGRALHDGVASLLTGRA